MGPGEAKNWRPVLVDNQTPWLRDYRGLWGLDTGDPFGGERAPACVTSARGRCGCAGLHPVRWAGLDKEAPTPAAQQQAMVGRIAELDAQLAATAAELDDQVGALRRPGRASGR